MDEKEIKKITSYIFLESEPQEADLAFVFGARHLDGAMNKVCELYHKGLVPKILASGGNNRATGENEAFAMNQKLIELGVKRDDIILEDQSTNSLENVLFSKKIIEKRFGWDNIRKITAIFKHYHSRRALMTLRKHLPKNIELIPAPYETDGFTKDNWFESAIGQERVMGEWHKILKYLTKGDIEEI